MSVIGIPPPVSRRADGTYELAASMPNREEIARRHGIAHLAHKLVGDSTEALEADAAAKAALIQMLSPRRLDEQTPEPAERPAEGRTDDQRLGDWVTEDLRPGAKRARNAEFLRSLGMLGDEGRAVTVMRACARCGRPSYGSYCSAHRPKPWATSTRKQRVGRSGSAEQRRAKRIIARYFDICHICGRPGADQVDHKVPLAEGEPDEE